MRIAFLRLVALSVILWSPLAAQAASDASRGNWPGIGASKSKAAGASKSAQRIARITSAPKRFVSSTKNMLTPKKTVTRKSGTTGIQRAKSASNEKQGYFKSLFTSQPPPPPKTINEWMSLKQIHP